MNGPTTNASLHPDRHSWNYNMTVVVIAPGKVCMCAWMDAMDAMDGWMDMKIKGMELDELALGSR